MNTDTEMGLARMTVEFRDALAADLRKWADALVPIEEPSLIDLVQELREAVGLFAGAMPITPKAAWEEALIEVRRLREAAVVRPTRTDIEGIDTTGATDVTDELHAAIDAAGVVASPFDEDGAHAAAAAEMRRFTDNVRVNVPSAQMQALAHRIADAILAQIRRGLRLSDPHATNSHA